MCGRYSITTNPEAMRQLFRFLNPPPNLPPHYNAAPTQELPVVRRDRSGARELVQLRWGLIPFWAKDQKIGYSTINAKAETVAEAPAFRAAFQSRRCLVAADGFYEWRQEGKQKKKPYRFTLKDGGPFAFAGLWERWRGPRPRSGQAVDAGGAASIESFTIIVTEANDLVRRIHDRMPVIIDPADYDAWLEAADTTIPMALLQPYPAEKMRSYPVSQRVNSPKNDDPDVIAEVQADPPIGDLFAGLGENER
jgi:putative SOS response-associated peptidase YedK